MRRHGKAPKTEELAGCADGCGEGSNKIGGGGGLSSLFDSPHLVTEIVAPVVVYPVDNAARKMFFPIVMKTWINLEVLLLWWQSRPEQSRQSESTDGSLRA